jgi:uncharacterized protein (TIGR02246 family)
MKKQFIIMSLILLLCFAFACQQAEEVVEEPARDVKADVQAIKELLENNASVISASDLDGWLAQFPDDAVFMNPNAEILVGVEASRQFAQPLFEQFDHEMAVTIQEVEVFGDQAFARWSFTWDYAPKAGGDTIQETGKEIWIFKRQDDNAWKCSHIIWNAGGSPPTSADIELGKYSALEAKESANIEADMEAIKSIIQETARTWNENDFEGYMALMNDDAAVLLDNGPALEGKEAIKSLYSNSFNLNSFDVAITSEEIHVWGDVAFSRDSWKGSANPKDGSEPIIFDNKTIFIYKKQINGSWKIWRNIYNSNLSPVTE